MDSKWASDHLQTIRTLMERSALYRRALAPVMLSAGLIGIAAAVVPFFTTIHSNRAFALFWAAVAMVAVATTFLLVRRQALRDQEPFWSPPTRRVTEALLPPLLAGGVVAVLLVAYDHLLRPAAWYTAVAWVILYGCALNAAGFFTPRGLKLFGRTFVLIGSVLVLLSPWVPGDPTVAAHCVMGGVFGLLHLAYGIYLYFTERNQSA
jgi:hypothetical protein